MESIYVLALAKSYRTSNDKELIRWDQEHAKIEGRVEGIITALYLLDFSTGSGGVLCLTIGKICG